MKSTADRATVQKRIMATVKSKDTTPEIGVRSAVHRAGYRFRLHDKHLPGTPDIVFARRRLAVFVHGCFWHGHDCKGGRLPKTNVAFWAEKIERNRVRDARVLAELESLGWASIVLWTCRLEECISELLERLRR